MKVIIVEDEKLSAEHLTLMLQNIDKNIEVIQYIDTVKAAVKAFKDGLQADLLFLDIHLADGNCFEIFTKVNIDIPIIFTTAFDNYAIQAFKQNSIDYLLKPIPLKDLQFAVDKFKKQKQVLDANLIGNVTRVYQQINNQYKSRFLVKRGKTIHSIETDDILFFETQDSLTFLVTTNKIKFPVDYALDQLETLLNPKVFYRINRKIIINIHSIDKIDSYFNGRLIITSKLLEGDERIVSRERVNDFKNWLNN